jgi:hypothetical protein
MSDKSKSAYEIRKFMLLVSERHLLRLQPLRASFALPPSGTSWRCSIAPASSFSEKNGALLGEGF